MQGQLCSSGLGLNRCFININSNIMMAIAVVAVIIDYYHQSSYYCKECFCSYSKLLYNFKGTVTSTIIIMAIL